MHSHIATGSPAQRSREDRAVDWRRLGADADLAGWPNADTLSIDAPASARCTIVPFLASSCSSLPPPASTDPSKKQSDDAEVGAPTPMCCTSMCSTGKHGPTYDRLSLKKPCMNHQRVQTRSGSASSTSHSAASCRRASRCSRFATAASSRAALVLRGAPHGEWRRGMQLLLWFPVIQGRHNGPDDMRGGGSRCSHRYLSSDAFAAGEAQQHGRRLSVGELGGLTTGDDFCRRRAAALSAFSARSTRLASRASTVRLRASLAPAWRSWAESLLMCPRITAIACLTCRHAFVSAPWPGSARGGPHGRSSATKWAETNIAPLPTPKDCSVLRGTEGRAHAVNTCGEHGGRHAPARAGTWTVRCRSSRSPCVTRDSNSAYQPRCFV